MTDPNVLASVLLRQSRLPFREARALLALSLGVSPEHLVAHPEIAVHPAAQGRFADLAARRRGGTPMAYLTGFQEFYGHALEVTPAVLIPRPETELLVDTAIRILPSRPGLSVLELGTGSGCIAITLALAQPHWQVVATDRCVQALAVAHRNSSRLQARVALVAADWFAPLGGARFDLIVSNPPYVAEGDPHLSSLTHEPRHALTDGADGLRALRTIIASAGKHLRPGGVLLLEHGYDQGPQVHALAREQGFGSVETLLDLEGRDRVCLARWQ